MNDFIRFIENLLGVYTPVVDSSGVIPSGFSGVDWPYMVRALIFVIVIYSVFRIIGGLICKM